MMYGVLLRCAMCAGPGGLCPLKTLAALPAALREAFESQQVENLHRAIAEMTTADARKYMKMCVGAGLWVSQDPHEFEGDSEEEEGEGEGEGGQQEIAEEDATGLSSSPLSDSPTYAADFNC